MEYTERFHLIQVRFLGLQIYQRVEISRVEVCDRVGNRNLSFPYFKGPLIKIFRTDLPYGCII